jgi:hypothetical protein
MCNAKNRLESIKGL